MVHICILFWWSILEQSCVVWGSSLTLENIEDLERTQKDKYKNYEDALKILNLDSLEARRKELTLKFAKSAIKNNTMNDIFTKNNQVHNMKTRKRNDYNVNFANTERLKKASVISMQNMLNEDTQK